MEILLNNISINYKTMSQPIDIGKLAIYYGWLSVINGSTDVPTAVSHIQAYDLFIAGAGLEDPGHADYANSLSILTDPGLAAVKLCGYVDATLSYTAIYESIDRWIDTLGVSYIFFDRIGYDFNVSRDKQNSLIEYVRHKGKHSFVNAWNPDDIFSSAVHATYNPQGLAATIDGDDIFLAESYQIINGAYQTENDWRTKSDKMIAYRTSFGTKMAAVTTYDASAYDQNKADYSYYSAALDDLDYWGWGEEFFSASSAQLPFRTRKLIYGDLLTGPIVQNGSVYERSTNVGIHVDAAAHTVDHIIA